MSITEANCSCNKKSCINEGGQYIFTMVDFFGGTFIFYVLTIIEVLSIMWWYGLENICLDIEFMLQKKPGIYWRVCWAALIPSVLIIVFVYFVATLEELTYENKHYPINVIVWGWLLFSFGVMQPLIWWVVQIVQQLKWEKNKLAIRNTFNHDGWGPKNDEIRKKWLEFKSDKNFKRRSTGKTWLINKLRVLIGK